MEEKNTKKNNEKSKTTEMNNKEKQKNTKDLKKGEKDKAKKGKDGKSNKFTEIVKNKWLINSSTTFLLVAIIIAVFIAITVFVQKLELTPIDLTEEKLFTLTEESKEKVKDINQDIQIYFVGYSEDDTALDLAKQYTKVNEKIKVEAVTATSRPDLVQKYQIDSSSEDIIVENGDRYKVLSSEDLYTYDQETYEQIDVTEEKLTAAIKTVSAEEIPNVYFLTGNTDFTLSSTMNYLNLYLEKEVNEVEEIDLLTKGAVPEDCNTLVITTPNQDFDEITTTAITNYISKGGNILWLNATTQSSDFANVSKILAMYGINPFDYGVIRETDSDKMVSNAPDFILPEVESSEVTNKITDGVIFINATKINVVDEDALTNLNVTKTELLNASSKSYFRTNFNETSDTAIDGETTGPFLIGTQMDKIVTEKNEENGTEEVKSTLIIYGENYFASDYPLSSSTQYPVVVYKQNKDLVLNSIAYLNNREEDISVRKGTNATTYTATEKEQQIILAIIFAIPAIIILAGIVVWRVRRKKF